MTGRPCTCIGCRLRGSRMEMVRVVRRESAVVVDSRGTMQGRGAWVHPDLSYLKRAVHSRAFERASKAAPLDTGAVEELLVPSDGNSSESRGKRVGRGLMGTR